jgi:hypothetical protein
VKEGDKRSAERTLRICASRWQKAFLSTPLKCRRPHPSRRELYMDGSRATPPDHRTRAAASDVRTALRRQGCGLSVLCDEPAAPHSGHAANPPPRKSYPHRTHAPRLRRNPRRTAPGVNQSAQRTTP